MMDEFDKIGNASAGDSVFIRRCFCNGPGLIIRSTRLYFLRFIPDPEDARVEASMDQAGLRKVAVSVTSISKIEKPDGTIVFERDERMMPLGSNRK